MGSNWMSRQSGTISMLLLLSRPMCRALQRGLLLPACHQGVYARLRRAMEKVGMRGRCRESELVEAPPHRAELGLSFLPCAPLPDQSRVYPTVTLKVGSKSAASDLAYGAMEPASPFTLRKSYI